jgi:hypothetical protein
MGRSKKSRRRHGYAPRFENNDTNAWSERPGYTMERLPGGGAVWIPNPRGGTPAQLKTKYRSFGAREADIAKIADTIFGGQSFFCHQELEQETVD